MLPQIHNPKKNTIPAKLIFNLSLCFALIFLAHPLFAQSKGGSHITHKKTLIPVPKNHILLHYTINPETSVWAILVAQRNENSKYKHTEFYKHQLITQHQTRHLQDVWHTKTRIFISRNGKNYALINFVDGGWSIRFSGKKPNSFFSWHKPIAYYDDGDIVVIYVSKYGNELIQTRIK